MKAKEHEQPEPVAPAHLSERSKGLWREVVPSRAKSAERQALVIAALEALDLADECMAQVRVEGLTRTTKKSGMPHVHPLLKIEKEQRSLFARLWGQLNFQWNQTIECHWFVAHASHVDHGPVEVGRIDR